MIREDLSSGQMPAPSKCADRLLDQPIVLLCSERAGSNLITKMFDSHASVSAPGAAHLFRLAGRFASRFAGREQAAEQVLRIFMAKMSSWLLDQRSPSVLLDLLLRANTACAMAALLNQEEATCAGKPYVFLKENSVHEYLPAITSVAHRPRYLFMVRDPRDMALSWLRAPALRGGIVRATQRWVSDQAGYLRVISQLPADARWAFVRYEDLLRSTDTELRRLCGELALEYDENMVSFHSSSRSAKTDAGRSFVWRNLAEPVLRDNTEKFRDQLSAQQICYVESRAGSLLQTFGYQPSGLALPDDLELAELERQMLAQEPFEKTAFLQLPENERQRLQAWSRLYAELDAMPCVPPAEARF